MLFELGVKSSKRDFFNFEEELRTLVHELRAPETRMIIIRGMRRTGKSSLLRVGLAESRVPHLLLDARAFGPFTPDQVYGLFSGSLSNLMKKHRSLRVFLERVKGVSIAGLRVDFTSRERPVLVEVLEKLNEWGRSENRPVVLALDEAQEFRFLPKFNGLLAHVYDYLKKIKLVMAGSEVGVLDEFLGKEKPRSPLFGRPYLEIKMGGLRREKAEEFLRSGLRQLGKRAKSEELSEALDVFDGVIGWLTSYGYYAWKVGHKKALTQTIREGAKLVREELESFLAPRRQARNRYLAILKMLVHPSSWSEVKRGLSAKLGRIISDKQLSHYLNELVDYGFVVRREGQYELADPLAKYALRR